VQVHSIQGAFGLEHLELVERDEPPAPGPGQVLVRMEAASFNYRDLMMVTGRYNPKQPLPLVPCSDGCGTVEAVGPEVTRVKAGERVITTFAQGWVAGPLTREKARTTLGGPLDGTLQERLLLSQEGVVRAPSGLPPAEAATLTCAGLTAWTALTSGGVAPGDVVLVQGTGGVSMFGLQLARLMGARVIVTSSSDAKLEHARRHGAWQTINYRQTPQWGARARELTGGRGVDHVLEVGGPETLAQTLQAVRPGAQVSLIGVLTGTKATLEITSILMQAVRVQGVLVGHRDGLEGLVRAVEAHALRPIVDRVFPWADARAALEHLQAGAHVGKVCLELGAPGA
jgi:NADPH:quinone reductase-like Zn-dependent oxidoreductase